MASIEGRQRRIAGAARGLRARAKPRVADHRGAGLPTPRGFRSTARTPRPRPGDRHSSRVPALRAVPPHDGVRNVAFGLRVQPPARSQDNPAFERARQELLIGAARLGFPSATSSSWSGAQRQRNCLARHWRSNRASCCSTSPIRRARRQVAQGIAAMAAFVAFRNPRDLDLRHPRSEESARSRKPAWC